MRAHHLKSTTVVAVVIAGLTLGLAAPAAGREARHLISGASIKKHSIAGNRLKANTLTGAQIKESTLGTVPLAKHADTLPPLTWHKLTLLNDWQSVYTSPPQPSYAVDAEGVVHLRGDILQGDASTDPDAFALPAAVHPDQPIYVTVDENSSATGQLEITANGTATIFTDPESGNAARLFTSLNGVTWSS